MKTMIEPTGNIVDFPIEDCQNALVTAIVIQKPPVAVYYDHEDTEFFANLKPPVAYESQSYRM